MCISIFVFEGRLRIVFLHEHDRRLTRHGILLLFTLTISGTTYFLMFLRVLPRAFGLSIFYVN